MFEYEYLLLKLLKVGNFYNIVAKNAFFSDMQSRFDSIKVIFEYWWNNGIDGIVIVALAGIYLYFMNLVHLPILF